MLLIVLEALCGRVKDEQEQNTGREKEEEVKAKVEVP
jgi:hypothetical protein